LKVCIGGFSRTPSSSSGATSERAVCSGSRAIPARARPCCFAALSTSCAKSYISLRPLACCLSSFAKPLVRISTMLLRWSAASCTSLSSSSRPFSPTCGESTITPASGCSRKITFGSHCLGSWPMCCRIRPCRAPVLWSMRWMSVSTTKIGTIFSNSLSGSRLSRFVSSGSFPVEIGCKLKSN